MGEGIKIAFKKDGKAVELNDEYCIYCANEEVFNKAKEAIEKQKPKKAVAKGVIYHCPNCNGVLNDIMKYSFCDRCGQAIDWSEDV